ncbi:MAG: alpha/beta hydrolase [Microbacteriaceae bacterium]|jgi:pimeloyl-ACP methyl ester carboxylesterase|nr:alpha/beta hydrolase [Microbacteriaceae bacterium]
MTKYSPYAAKLGRIPIERREISVLGSTTRYWVYGAEDAETTIVIAHGYRGEHHGLEPVIAQLPGIRWIGADMPGFGESTPLTEVPHSIDGFAQWFTTFVDELGLTGTAVTLGHSFGTIISSRAVSAGLKTPALILINPISTSGLKGPSRVATLVTVAYYRLAGRLPNRLGAWILRRWFVVQFMSSTLAKTKDKQLRGWIHDQHHTYFNNFANRDFVVEAFEASVGSDVSEFAAQIGVPTLLVAAELDDITPVQAHHDVIAIMPDARLTLLMGVGHLIHYEVPELAAAAIKEFLEAQGFGVGATEEPRTT